MITAGDFRNGLTFDMDGEVMQVIEFQHVKPGKGAAFVRTKLRNVISGAVTETTFNPTAKFPEAYIERRDMEYLYNDENLYYFMDTETYEQQAEEGISDLVSIIEPTMVAALSIVIGAVLLSVMMPMAGIISSIL